jgi:hypothetical protein
MFHFDYPSLSSLFDYTRLLVRLRVDLWAEPTNKQHIQYFHHVISYDSFEYLGPMGFKLLAAFIIDYWLTNWYISINWQIWYQVLHVILFVSFQPGQTGLHVCPCLSMPVRLRLISFCASLYTGKSDGDARKHAGALIGGLISKKVVS